MSSIDVDDCSGDDDGEDDDIDNDDDDEDSRDVNCGTDLNRSITR